jgi:hypothetical protein
MRIWELRAYLNSLPISMDDVEVFYHGGVDRFDNKRVFLNVDFIEPCETEENATTGILLHNGYIEDDETELELALLN